MSTPVEAAEHAAVIEMPSQRGELTVLRSAEPRPQETALLATIAAAATNAEIDVDKMERLLEMQARITADQARREFFASLHLFQSECPPIYRKRAIVVGSQTRSTYASYEDVIAVAGPLMMRHGFSASFDTAVNPSGVICSVTVTLSHIGGHFEKSTFPVMPDSSGSKNSIQAIGSALSYGKRYALGAALGLVFTDEDDDGRESGRAAETERELEVSKPRWTMPKKPEAQPRPMEAADPDPRDRLIRLIAEAVRANGVADNELANALNALYAKSRSGHAQIDDWTVDLTDKELEALADNSRFSNVVAEIYRQRKGGAK